MIAYERFQVADQYVEFLSPSPSFFSLVKPQSQSSRASPSQSSYELLNSPSTSEVENEAEIERIAAGLFAVIVTQGGFYMTVTKGHA